MGIRLYSMDATRVLAMILVIIVHTRYYFFAPDVHSSLFAMLTVVGTVGVPLFVILTGYLMFDRNYEDNTYLQKYIMRNLLPLITAYEFWNITWNILRYTHVVENPQKWSTIIKAALFMGDTLSALWYLPMTIALYLGMPILSIAVHKITLSSYQKLLFIALILSGTIIPSFIPLFSLFGHTPSIHSVLKMNIFGASVWGESVWMIYLLSGYAIYKGILKFIKTSVLSVLGIILPIGIMYGIKYSGHHVQHYDFVLVVLLSISTFELLTRGEQLLQSNSVLCALITSISKISFGVYMLHIFVGGAIFQLLKATGLDIPIGKSFSGLLSIIYYFIFITSIVITSQIIMLILRKNKLIRRYVLLMK